MAYKKFVSMDIGIVGSGTVGSSLAMALAEAGHKVYVGVRDETCYKGRFALSGLANIHILNVEELAFFSDVIIIATPASVVPEVAYYLGDVQEKVVIDMTYGEGGPQTQGYAHGVQAIERITGCPNVIKCFNTTVYENLVNPHLSEELIEMYVAGDSKKAKAISLSLCRDLRFANGYDLGGSSNIALLEEMAASWIGMAQKPVSVPVVEGLKVSR
jgi:hypothetical protein